MPILLSLQNHVFFIPFSLSLLSLVLLSDHQRCEFFRPIFKRKEEEQIYSQHFRFLFVSSSRQYSRFFVTWIFCFSASLFSFCSTSAFRLFVTQTIWIFVCFFYVCVCSKVFLLWVCADQLPSAHALNNLGPSSRSLMAQAAPLRSSSGLLLMCLPNSACVRFFVVVFSPSLPVFFQYFLNHWSAWPWHFDSPKALVVCVLMALCSCVNFPVFFSVFTSGFLFLLLDSNTLRFFFFVFDIFQVCFYSTAKTKSAHTYTGTMNAYPPTHVRIHRVYYTHIMMITRFRFLKVLSNFLCVWLRSDIGWHKERHRICSCGCWV